MKYSIDIDHELKIIRYRHAGIILGKDIEMVWQELIKIKEFTQLKYDLLSDYRDGDIQIPVVELPQIIEFMRSIEEIVRGKKQALIVDHPKSVARSVIFQNSVNREVGFIVKVFSAETAALNCLLH